MGDVILGQLDAELTEFFRREITLAESIVLFDLDLSRQPVTVPALREKHVEPAHSLVAGDDVEVGPV